MENEDGFLTPITLNTCVKLAYEGEECKGFDESEGKLFPDCAPGLYCRPSKRRLSDEASNECIYAEEGENCEGFNERTG